MVSRRAKAQILRASSGNVKESSTADPSHRPKYGRVRDDSLTAKALSLKSPQNTNCPPSRSEGDRDANSAKRRPQRKERQIPRPSSPADIAALAVHLMTNTAVTGATYHIDGGEQLVEG
jgi:NAD(P)-dependent dehydrogenase (short-subunit alcohol dehydrogenase family)